MRNRHKRQKFLAVVLLFGILMGEGAYPLATRAEERNPAAAEGVDVEEREQAMPSSVVSDPAVSGIVTASPVTLDQAVSGTAVSGGAVSGTAAKYGLSLKPDPKAAQPVLITPVCTAAPAGQQTIPMTQQVSAAPTVSAETIEPSAAIATAGSTASQEPAAAVATASPTAQEDSPAPTALVTPAGTLTPTAPVTPEGTSVPTAPVTPEGTLAPTAPVTPEGTLVPTAPVTPEGTPAPTILATLVSSPVPTALTTPDTATSYPVVPDISSTPAVTAVPTDPAALSGSATPAVPDATPGTASPAVSVSPFPSGIPTSAPVPTTLPTIRFISRIEVTDTLVTVPYGSTFTKDQITITVYYSDGTTSQAKPDSVTPADTSRLGVQALTVSYQGFSTNYEITVVPRQVTGVKMKTGTSTTMTVVWNSLPEAEQYNIYISKIKNGTFTFIDSTEKETYTFKNLQPGQIIYIQIRAMSGELEGEPSAVTPIAPRPGKASGLKATYIVRQKVTLTWKPASGATGYAIYYRLTTDKEYTHAGSVKAEDFAYMEALTYTVKGLTAGKDYYFMVCAFAVDLTNQSDASEAVLYGTAPKLPEITLIKGGNKRIKLYWSKSRGAQSYQLSISAKKNSGYKKKATVKPDEYRVRGIGGLKQKKTYYVKVTAVRDMSGFHLTTESEVMAATTKKAKSTSTKPKLYKTKKKFKNSAACKKYKAFRKKVKYNKSFVCPGLTNTNVAGFDCRSMIPQGLAFAGRYMLISAFDYQKEQESVIYVMDKKTKKYLTTLVMPHMGHLGGIAFDGTNLWIAYGKNLQCLKYSVIAKAVASREAFWEITQFTTQCAIPETASYVGYYKGRVWAGSYNEYSKKYMYAFQISDKNGTPRLKKTNQILMPNRTQGVAFTPGGKLIISRSCQTRKELPGFMSQLETYKPKWNFSKGTLKLKKCKRVMKLPPMNEGIALNGSYTYVLYESSYFWDCLYKVDRVTAFKTGKVS